MIGNDIVDIQVAQKESNWNRPRFLQKIFTLEEQEYIHAASDKNKAVWLLWSRKESAYKIIVRLLKKRFFAPKELVNKFDTTEIKEKSSEHLGQVTYRNHLIDTKSIVTDKYIHTVAYKNHDYPPVNINSFFFHKNDYATQHKVTLQHLIKYYTKLTKSSGTNLNIRKNAQRIPHLYDKNQKLNVQISTSHHGHYGGFVLQPSPHK